MGHGSYVFPYGRTTQRSRQRSELNLPKFLACQRKVHFQIVASHAIVTPQGCHPQMIGMKHPAVNAPCHVRRPVVNGQPRNIG